MKVIHDIPVMIPIVIGYLIFLSDSRVLLPYTVNIPQGSNNAVLIFLVVIYPIVKAKMLSTTIKTGFDNNFFIIAIFHPFFFDIIPQ